MATTTPPKITAAELMTPAPRTCSSFSTVLEAVLIFRDADCGAVPIVEDGKPIGILTDRDVALALSEFPDLSTRSVADIMTKGVVTVAPGAPADEVVATFSEKGVRRLLVIDAQQQLLGIISWADIAPRTDDCDVGRVVTEVVEQP
jgi:CBS domain-containing protein